MIQKTLSILAILILPLVAYCQTDEKKETETEKPNAQTKPPIPIYITPYYESEGTKIKVGEYSEKIAKADANTILALSETLKKQRDNLRLEVMFVMAIRLYDLGHKDEGVYWYYTAQYRGRLFANILDKNKIGSLGSEPFELRQAYGAFMQLAGQYLNGYAFGDLPKLEKTLDKVLDEGKQLPKFHELYPNVTFIEQEKWVEANQTISKGLTEMKQYIKENSDSIREQRKKNGMDGKF
ncbi:MAG: hypothetical protein U0930_16905 [Pirellulales bacterium]